MTVLHSLARPLNPSDPAKAAKVNTEGAPHAWQAPLSNPKLSTALETYLKQINIEFIGNAKVNIPSGGADGQDPAAWNGSAGLQDGVKRVTLPDGKVIEGDYFFIGVGNKSNAGFVESSDKGAVVNGLVGVDEYLKVSATSPQSPSALLTLDAGTVVKSRFAPHLQLLRHRGLLQHPGMEDFAGRQRRCRGCGAKVGPHLDD